ncbi:AAA family ATPase [Nocardia sp. NBC_00881]|uniref:helix-turn-helix transcriptional regulator n=1 Tax=Nocardia sp. NBC_00881 TaxID=2975995 RepID=UPI003863C392|nr:AAA family ATPase [Nocardia sp. NBC_00881]
MRRATAQFVGRVSELGQVSVLIEQAAAGRGAMVWVDGEPGIGKTTLLDQTGQLAESRGLQVFRGAARELEQHIPFAAVRSCLSTDRGTQHPLTERVRTLLRGEGVRDDGAISHEFVVVEAILALVEGLCADGPVAVILDDLQWADPSSLLVVRSIAEIVSELPLLMMLAARPLPRGTSMSRLLSDLDDRGAERMHLRPFAGNEVDALVRNQLGAKPGPELTAVMTGAGGNPLYVTELVAGLVRAARITIVDGIATSVDGGASDESRKTRLPASLSEAIVQRLDFLSEAARRVLAVAAALGPQVEAVELAEVLGGPVIDIWNAISEAMDAGILIRSNGELAFRHDLIWQVFADQVPESTRRSLQLRTAQVLISMDAPVERVANCLTAGSGPLDNRSLEWLIGAAGLLIIRAPELAVSLLERAATTSNVDSADRDIVRMRHIQALLWSGRAEEAETAARNALAALPSADRQSADGLRWLLAQACFGRGNLREAVAVTEATLAQPGLSQQEQGRHHGFRALTSFFLEDFAAAEEAATRAVSVGDACDDKVASGFGYLTLGALRYTEGYLDRALELANRVVVAYETGIRGQDHSDQFDPYVLLVHCLIELDRSIEADEALNVAIPHGGVYLASNLLARARLNYLEGRWEDGLAEIHACLEAPDIFGYANVAHSQAALIAVHRGTFVSDPDTIPDVDDRLGSRGYLQFRPLVQALAHESQGRPDQALEILWGMCGRVAAGLTASTLYIVYPDVARLAATCGANDIAAAVTAAAELLVTRQATPSRRGTALLCRGLSDRRPELLAEAAECFRIAGRPLYEGQAQENLAVVLATSERTAEARSALDSAIDLYGDLDAEWDIARAEARLRQHGIRRGRRGPRGRPKTGWTALTPTEQKVAHSVAQGLSNSDIADRMFLSRRTVQSHVSSILAKLGLSSRVQVAIEVAGKA